MTLIRYSSKRLKLTLVLLSSLLISGGCAVKPWTDPLADRELEAATDLINIIQTEQHSCGKTLSGDLNLLFENPFSKKSVTGYFQFSQPSKYKFIVSNPFGQPVLIATGNHDVFRLINTLSRKYIAGSLSSFGIRNNVPAHFLKGNWHEWLTGSKTEGSTTILETIRNGSELKGFWVTYRSTDRKELDHLFIDHDQHRVTRRLLESEEGERRAEITYNHWITVGECSQPLEIFIKGLEFNTKIQLKLSEISFSNEETNSNIPIPHGFTRTYFP